MIKNNESTKEKKECKKVIKNNESTKEKKKCKKGMEERKKRKGRKSPVVMKRVTIVCRK